ncbi:hypothetical protein DERP_009577 [Dermatophagoides pteronyssinus]|uniref:Uncharacterized protein n=1 Tax=Dermatophagoides pteronyssinus TaxID=6956 RepID=A0ABQ8JAQ6_DERPT|nr:hypothetical protein DERP_009577 [Dermatophagoides pteronyssinus]
MHSYEMECEFKSLIQSSSPVTKRLTPFFQTIFRLPKISILKYFEICHFEEMWLTLNQYNSSKANSPSLRMLSIFI